MIKFKMCIFVPFCSPEILFGPKTSKDVTTADVCPFVLDHREFINVALNIWKEILKCCVNFII